MSSRKKVCRSPAGGSVIYTIMPFQDSYNKWEICAAHSEEIFSNLHFGTTAAHAVDS